MSKRKEIANFVLRKIKYLEATETHSNSNAELARLRRGVGKKPGEIPELYGIFLKDMPEDFWNKEGTVTRAEWSCYIALTLYAVHQQGNMIRAKNMHTDENVSIGHALHTMVTAKNSAKADSNEEERVLKKLQMLITSKDMGEFSYHLRNVITLLRGCGIPINYGRLAEDIYSFQVPESKDKVCLAWGQDFYRKKEEKEDEK